MQNYCTLFNIKYLSRGLNLYYSLKKVSKKFKLFIFAFDNPTYEFLIKKKLQNVIIISLNEFEDKKLKNVKKQRTQTEYFWTCTGSTILYLFKKYKLKSCTYLDADLFFYRDPKILFEEKKNSSCIISKHNYTKRYDQTNTSGIYCVQFMYFRNNTEGKKILNDWRKQCIDWCFNRFENGKFGDQKYLDNWPKKYKNVHILRHVGAGVAPWNIQQYKLLNNLQLLSLNNKAKFELIFYHFHNIKIMNKKVIYIGGYNLSKEVIEKIYKPYLLKLINMTKILNKNKMLKDVNFDENYYSEGIFIFRLIKRLFMMNNFLKLK
jgi:hypothetical protein